MSEITTISIPKPLADKIKKNIQGTGFGSVSSWVTYVLRQIISGMNGKEFTKDDEENVKRRLRGLGYMG